MNLVAALEEVREYASGSQQPEEVSQENVERANERSLMELQNLLSGVKK